MRTGSYRNQERTRALVELAKLGVPDHVALDAVRLAAGMARRAELACSSEAADRDRVDCPPAFRTMERRQNQAPVEWCLCRDHGAYDDAQPEPEDRHGRIPRIAVQDARAERRITALMAPYVDRVELAGDPRGYVVKVVKVVEGQERTVGLA